MSGVISLDQVSGVVRNTLGKRIDSIRIAEVSSLLSSKISFSNTTKELVLCETSPTFRVLVGQLKNKVSLQTFNLEFDDGRACINAYICSSFSCCNFNRKIIVVKWNLIRSNDKDYYLEIIEVVPVENDCVAELNGLKCSASLGVNDACFLLHNRNFIDKGSLSVIGHLSAVSEIIRLKKTFVFILELKDNVTNRTVDVLVREPSQLHWQRILVPDCDYLLTGLKPTTLYSGEPSERKLFICTSSSQLFPISAENDEVALNVINIEEYFESSGVPDVMTVYSKWCEANKVEPQTSQFVTYQGVVSNCDRAADGFFELDSKIRLYVTHVSSSTSFCQLRVGTRVAVFNAHLGGHSEHPKIQLFCCSRACIKVISFAKTIPSDVPLSAHQTATASRDVSTVSRLVTDLCLRVDELVAFLDACLKLAEKYGSSSCMDELARLAVCGTAGVGLGPLQNRSHNALANFYAAEHELCRKMPTKPFTVPTIADVQAHYRATVAGDDDTTDPAGTGCQWRLKVIASSDLRPPWVLIGTLRTSRKTGNLQLVDRTGAIDCVIASRPSSLLPSVTVSRQQHRCTTSCCNSASDGCPYAQTWSLNICYRIDYFQLVVETFPHPDGQSVDRSYIQFSMLDAMKLCDMLAPPNQCHQSRVKPTQGDIEPGLSTSTVQNPTKRSRVDPSETSASVDDASRHSLKTIENSASCGVSLRQVETSCVQTCKCSVSQIFVVENIEISSLRSRIPMQMSLSLTAVGFFIAAPRVFSKACSICSSSETPGVPVGIPPVRRVSTIFQGRSLCSAGVLHPGCVYRLSRLGSRDLTTFTGKRTMQGNLEKMASTRMILLDCELDIIRLVQPFDGNGCDPELRSLLSADVVVAIGNILGDVRIAIDSRPSIWTNADMDDSLSCCPLALVSFTGLIVSRSHCAPQLQYKSGSDWKINPEMELLSVSVPQNLTVMLIVRNMSSSAESAIYMGLDGMLYPLGLLPGATVRFDRLQSKTSSRDRRYCQFTIASSCSVASFAPTMSDNAMLGRDVGSHMTNQAELPATRCVVYLAELWKNSVIDDVFCVVGHVTMVLRVSLNVDGTRAGAQFMSSASFLIDDGSSTAFVSCSGRLVADLLDLNADQWSAVEDWVRRVGNIHYTLQGRRDNIAAASAALANVDGRTARTGNSAVFVECFLRELCDSCAVKRTVTVYARRFRTVLNKHGQKCANINGWLLADFERRSIRKGNVSFESTVLPSLQLECVALVTIK